MVTALAMVLETAARAQETAPETAKGIAVFLLKLHRLHYFLPGVEMAMAVMDLETVPETAGQDLETAPEMALVLEIVPTPDTSLTGEIFNARLPARTASHFCALYPGLLSQINRLLKTKPFVKFIPDLII